MKRRLLIIAVFLLLGAVVNVAVPECGYDMVHVERMH